MQVLWHIGATIFVALATMFGAEYLRSLYSTLVVASTSNPAWTMSVFVGVWCLDLVAWAAAGLTLTLLIRSHGWYWWILSMGALVSFMHWPLYIVHGPQPITGLDYVLVYGHSLLPLLGSALGAAVGFGAHRLVQRPANNRWSGP